MTRTKQCSTEEKRCEQKSSRILPAWLFEENSETGKNNSRNMPRKKPKPKNAKIRERIAAIEKGEEDTDLGKKESLHTTNAVEYKNKKEMKAGTEVYDDKKRGIEEVEMELEKIKKQKKALEDEMFVRLKEEKRMLGVIREREERIGNLLEKQAESDAIIASLKEDKMKREMEGNPQEDDVSSYPQHCPYSPEF